ncbi:MAG TPA: hypothetical protein VMO47_03450 [Rhodothermales bacterium]|nr:hypothetical protein [Rhodothermales bacterium]
MIRTVYNLNRQVFAVVSMLSAVLVAVAPQASAQSRSDGSVYSRYGLGDRHNFHSSQANAMGVLGTGLHGPAYLNTANPATYADQVFARFTAGIDFLGFRSEDVDGQTSISSGGHIGAIQLGFPLIARKLGFAASISPYTTSGYHAQLGGTLEAEGSEPPTDFEVNYEGDGGLQEAVVGFGYQVTDKLAVGVSASAIWGIIEFGQRTEYARSTDYLLSTEQFTSTRMSGFSGSLGAAFRSPRLVGESDAFTVGAAFSLPVHLSATRTNQVTQGLVLIDTVGSTIEGDLTLPLRLQAGLSYTPSPKWLILADGLFEPWGGFESDYPLLGYEPGQEDAFNSRLRAGAGVQYIPSPRDPFASTLKRTAYRFGLFVDQSYVRPVPDYDLKTYGASTGLSIPTVVPGTYLDLSGQIGFRGESETDLVRDLLYKFSITLNFGERWFLQRRLR